jgi:hypothetical protein
MRILKILLLLALGMIVNNISSQTVVKMDLPPQADLPLKVVALFDEDLRQVLMGILSKS